MFSVEEFKMKQNKSGKDLSCIMGGYGAERAVIVFDSHSLMPVYGICYQTFLEYQLSKGFSSLWHWVTYLHSLISPF